MVIVKVFNNSLDNSRFLDFFTKNYAKYTVFAGV